MGADIRMALGSSGDLDLPSDGARSKCNANDVDPKLLFFLCAGALMELHTHVGSTNHCLAAAFEEEMQRWAPHNNNNNKSTKASSPCCPYTTFANVRDMSI